jgi:autotransporter-associated beta strand protein
VIGSGTVSTLKANNASGNATVYGGSLGDGIALVKLGAGTLRLTGVSSYSGGTTVEQGTLVAAGSLSLSSGSVAVKDGASLVLDGGSGVIQLSNALSVAGSGSASAGALISASGDNVLSGQITLGGTSKIAVTAGSLLTSSISGTSSDLILQGTITVGGAVNLGIHNDLTSDGKLQLLGDVTAKTVRIDGGSVSLGGNVTGVLQLSAGSGTLLSSKTVTSLASSGAATFDLGGNTLTITNGANLTAAGAITGAGGGLVLNGGSLTLGGVNTYGGGTTVNGGSLSVTGSLSNTGALTIATGGTVEFREAAILGAIANNGVLNFLSTGTMASLTGSGVTTFGGGVTLGDITGGSLTIATTNKSADNNLGALSGVALTVTVDTTVNAISFAGASADLGGTLIVSGEVSGGTLKLASTGSLSAGTLSGGTLETVMDSRINANGGVFTGEIKGSGELKTSGFLTLGGTAVLSGSLGYKVAQGGSLTLAAGTVR